MRTTSVLAAAILSFMAVPAAAIGQESAEIAALDLLRARYQPVSLVITEVSIVGFRVAYPGVVASRVHDSPPVHDPAWLEALVEQGAADSICVNPEKDCIAAGRLLVTLSRAATEDDGTFVAADFQEPPETDSPTSWRRMIIFRFEHEDGTWRLLDEKLVNEQRMPS